ncbi:bifunctional DNA primase/polymerase [Mycobacteroides abscessus subsp. abscessus]|uniref:bifunctional DNA primase/polymerase n=1 Tax=Mycobacteroides abscessus TaxID=36809 RepID=UPI0039F09369
MREYSTCRVCGEAMQVTAFGQMTHPLCEDADQLTPIEVLTAQWLEAAIAGDDAKADALQAEIDGLDGMPPRLKASALYYSQVYGWPVFPLKPLSKVPATRAGFKDATTNRGQIEAWWNANPRYNIGLPTGVRFDVIDVDPPAGMLSLHELLTLSDPRTGKGPIPDVHGKVATASGGVHLYIERAGRGNAVNLLPGIDIRGRGGYVVAPPSTLGERGRNWSWSYRPSPILATTERKALSA